MMQYSDTDILTDLKAHPEKALRELYDRYYQFICGVIFKMIGDGAQSEDLAQEVFVEVWRRRSVLDVSTSLRGYLRRVAVNKTLNHLRAQKMDFDIDDAILEVPNLDSSTQQDLEAQDLQSVINKAVDSLPSKCRMIFGLSRFEQKSYNEISQDLGISIKTVENQISKALKLLRMAVLTYQQEKN